MALSLRHALGFGFLAGLVSIAGVVWMHERETASPSRSTAEDLAIQGAKAVLEETLAAPSTAHYLSFASVEAENDWHMVHVVLDAQNTFGAMLRQSVCVTFKIEGDQARWTRAYAMQQCSKPPTAEEISLLKIANGWPAPSPAPSVQ